MKNTVFTTPGGKEITTYVDPVNSHYKIKFLSGGELPQELAGLFTNVVFAERAITSYLNKATTTKEVKKKQDQVTKEA